jgi:hypothetical protein
VVVRGEEGMVSMVTMAGMAMACMLGQLLLGLLCMERVRGDKRSRWSDLGQGRVS